MGKLASDSSGSPIAAAYKEPILQLGLASLLQKAPGWLAGLSSKIFGASPGEQHAKSHRMVWCTHRREMSAIRPFIGSTRNLFGAGHGHSEC